MNFLAHHVAKQFTVSSITELTPIGNGLINDTFLVKTEDQDFILQRINTQVFPNPQFIMHNLSQLKQHIKETPLPQLKLTIPGFLTTHKQQDYYLDQENGFWRTLEFIGDSVSKETITNSEQAQQVGFALGYFHRLFHNADTALFHDTLPGFHITPSYFKHYLSVDKNSSKARQSKKNLQCKAFIKSFEPKINSLEQAKKQGLLIERITHGDPKLNNFLFQNKSNNIISLIDLDTVKPGLVHYDIADCLRSSCHIPFTNTFNFDLCKSILERYLKETASFFTEQDYAFLYPAIELIPFELGLRFFTDFLEGNKYFKVSYAEQNLDKALSQFQLCESISTQEDDIKLFLTSLMTKNRS